jgi:hypothetical protein
MADPKSVLIKLTQNLNTLQQREAKYGSNAPLELLNQIEDHEKAIALTEQAIVGELSQAEWCEALRPLTIDYTIVEGGLIQRLFAAIAGDTAQQRALRNRQVMLRAVKQFWVEGVLENSLHNAVLLELGMVEKREAVTYPWEMILQTPHQPHRTLIPGTRMINIFDQHQTLLILGEPGAGKTTMLLELARQTIARAETDPTQPMPVVFNLSSWAERRPPLAEWLVEELNTKYSIPKKIAQVWVDNDALLLLLDGLDEVAQAHRLACVEAINAFRQNSLMPVVVCSRVADYEGLSVKLRLAQAIVLQAFTPQQIEEYLVRFGSELVTLKMALQQEANLRELAQSPLMLSIMTLAYQSISAEKLLQLNSVETQRQRLFEIYVGQMLKRRSSSNIYRPEQTIYWLTWLAKRMQHFSQPVFLIEQIQPQWLDTNAQFNTYLGCISLFMLFTGTGMASAGVDIGKVAPVESLNWSLQKAKIDLRKLGKLEVRFVKSIMLPYVGLGLVMAIGFGLYFGLRGVGPFAGLGLSLLFIVGFYSGLSTPEIEDKIRPNQGIWQSAKNAIFVGLFTGLIIGLGQGLGFVLFIGVEKGFMDGLTMGFYTGIGTGLAAGLIFGMFSGGMAYVQHFIIRFMVYRSGAMPWNYPRFLDYATDRIFLHKVGGGYIFIHRYLMEYFASLEPEQAE